VRTYIQSGNVVFLANPQHIEELKETILNAIEQHYGFRPLLKILSGAQLVDIVRQNPFPIKNKALHFYFLDTPPADPQLEKLNDLKTATENFRLKGDVFYLYAPDGIGRSKLAARVEQHLDVSATARN